MTSLSVIILCYKAEKFSKIYLNKVLDVLSENKIDNYEIILVGNIFQIQMIKHLKS